MGFSTLPTRVRVSSSILVVTTAVVLALIIATWPARTDDGERPKRPGRGERAAYEQEQREPRRQPTPTAEPTQAPEPTPSLEPAQRQPRPNIVLITTDDQSDAEMRFMPRTRRLIGEAGIDFTDAINPHPLCCPARAEILTGEYAHNNGVRHNDGPYGGWSAFVAGNEKENLGPWLRRAGYRTGFVGKNLNEYTFDDPRPRGWDFFSPTGERTYSYYGTTFYNDGEPRGYGRKYVADIVRDESERLIKRWAAEPEPFFLWASHVGPHAAYVDGWRSPVPARRHADMFGDLKVATRAKASFNEDDVSDKPAALRGRAKVSMRKLTRQVRDRARSLQAIDQANAATIRALRRSGELDDTLVVFVSDNGFLLGEHRVFGKDLPYDEALQVPLLARGPGITPGTTSRATASLVDLAPTFLDHAGVAGRGARRRTHRRHQPASRVERGRARQRHLADPGRHQRPRGAGRLRLGVARRAHRPLHLHPLVGRLRGGLRPSPRPRRAAQRRRAGGVRRGAPRAAPTPRAAGRLRRGGAVRAAGLRAGARTLTAEGLPRR